MVLYLKSCLDLFSYADVGMELIVQSKLGYVLRVFTGRKNARPLHLYANG